MKPITKKQKNTINKLLVVGHPLSDYEQVLELLNDHDIKIANPLKREGVEASEISNILLQAHNIEDSLSEEIEQITVKPVWNGLAMDLMMSNLNYTKWAWADSEALPFLSYWKSLDSDLLFILVYHSPQKILETLITQSDSSIDFQKEIKRWVMYNRTLLNFYYRNQDSSLLVSSEQVQMNTQKYLLEVGKQIGLNIQELLETTPIESTEEKEEINKPNNHLNHYLTQHLVDENIEAAELYQELQSVSNLPHLDSNLSSTNISEAINSYTHEKQFTKNLSYDLHLLKKANKQLVNQLLDIQVEFEKTHSTYKNKVEKLKKELQEVKNNPEKSQKIHELETENELLLKQLFTVQEKLEQLYLEKEKIHNKTSNKQHYGAADRIKQQLSYRLGAKMIENSKSIKGILSLPYVLYRERKEFQKQRTSQKKLPPIHTYADAYDAEQIKKHLSYRLGQAMVHNMKSPLSILKLPFVLKRAYTEFQKERK